MFALVAALAASFSVTAGCDKLGGSSKSKKSAADESDEDDDKKSKKKKKKKKDAETDEDEVDETPSAKPKPAGGGVPVPGIAGFVVPSGGMHQRPSLNIEGKVLEFENYTYPLPAFPREKLHADFNREIAAAGWSVRKDASLGYIASKDGVEVSVLFGEAGEAETKINVFPPKAAAPPPPPGGDVVFAGAYSSVWGVVTLTQARATPLTVTGKYGRGSMKCAALGEKLDCAWVESSGAGRAAFTRDATGNLKGTWGNGGSSTSGGAWNLTLTKAGTLSDG